MEWRWSWIWTIFWNMLIHAVTLNWGALGRDADDLKSWWRSLWSEIENRVNNVRNWAQGQISWLSGYAFGLYVQAVNWINSQIGSLRSWAQGQISWLSGYAFGLYIQARNWIDSQIASIRSWVQPLINAVYAWVRPYVDNLINWVRSIYEWVQPYRDLITNFLTGARGAIQWLWHTAWGTLQAFLANPLGFVLGWLLDPIRNLINWWQRYGPLLMNYVANELSEWLTLWTNGKRILKALVDNPEGFVLDLLAPKFLDWLAQLIADNW